MERSEIKGSSARDHASNTYVKSSGKTNIPYPLIRTYACAYQGVRNVSFSENFASTLNEFTTTKCV